MHRRTLFTVWLSLALAGAPLAHAEPEAAPHLSVPVARLQTALAQRFPMRYPVPNLLELEVQTPRLQLLPAANRLRAALDLQAAGPALQRVHQGSLDVDFALRFEASDRTVRAYRLSLQRLQFPTLQPGVVALLNSYAPQLAQQSLLEVVLYTLSPKDLELADTLGVQPGSITVTDEGLEIALVPKPL